MDTKKLEKEKKIRGWTDKQVKMLSSKQISLVEEGEEFRKWRLIAEVLEAKNCIAGVKKGR